MSTPTISLPAQARDQLGKAEVRRIRRQQDLMPAVVYGAGKESVSIAIEHRHILKALGNEAVYSQVLDLVIDGKKEKVVLKALQRHPYKVKVLHADFLRVDAKQALHIAHLFYLRQLLGQVLQSELAFERPTRGFFGFFPINSFSRLFNQPYHVAHTQNTTCDTIRLESLKCIEFFANPHELDGTAGGRPHGERSSASGIPIDPCKHDAGNADLIIERLGSGDGILAAQGVSHQQRLRWLDRITHQCHFHHEFMVNG